MLLRCPRKTCRRLWDFKGKARFVTSCPRCRTTVYISKNRQDKIKRLVNVFG